jgi:hypothetical protein
MNAAIDVFELRHKRRANQIYRLGGLGTNACLSVVCSFQTLMSLPNSADESLEDKTGPL